MGKLKVSKKQLAIDKANATLFIAVAVAAFVVTFSVVASKVLLDQRAYQARVISKKEQARDTLEKNITTAEALNTSYQEFANSSVNVLGGNPSGNGDKDGPNPRIVLDALPSEYDFPALATSVEKLLKSNNFTLTDITGTDDEASQASNSQATTPVPVEMPITVESKVNASEAKRLVQLFERSIRPFQIQKLELTQQNDNLTVKLTAKSYFQPGKSLNVKYETVK